MVGVAHSGKLATKTALTRRLSGEGTQNRKAPGKARESCDGQITPGGRRSALQANEM